MTHPPPLLRALAVGIVLLAGACSRPPGPPAPSVACGSGQIAGQGSSAQAAAMNGWIRSYQLSCPEAAVGYSSTGSTAGLAAFIAGTGDFAGSDSPLADADQAKANARCGTGPAIQLPLVVGPIAVAYNLTGVDHLNLSPDTIAGLFSGRIQTWDDPRLARDNPGVALPARAVRPVHRSDRSGTTDNFTRYLGAGAAGEWTFGSSAEWPAPGGVGAKGSTGVIEQVERSDGAIGYVEASYARFHEVPVAQVSNAAHELTGPTDEAAGAMVAGARSGGEGNDLKLTFDYRNPIPGAYPLVLVTYEVVCQTGSAPMVGSFLTYAASPAGQGQLVGLGYAPLPEAIRARVAAAVATL